jgi:GT2 family glycosyltransferase
MPPKEIQQTTEARSNSSYFGFLDGLVGRNVLKGWVYNKGEPAKSNDIDIVIDGKLLTTAKANEHRSDLIKHGFVNPNCAFSASIPAKLLDGRIHVIEVFVSGTRIPLKNSPLSIRLGSAQSTPDNLLTNATFAQWTGPLHEAITKPRQEIVKGWYFDFKKSFEFSAHASLAKPNGFALRPDEYGIRIELTPGKTTGYFRMFTPVDIADCVGHRLIFRCAFSPDLDPDSDLHIAEVFLAASKGPSFNRIARIARNIRPGAAIRRSGSTVAVTPEMLAAIDPGEQALFVFDFAGKGAMTIFAPFLGSHHNAESLPAPDMSFEDPRVQNQIALLKLSKIWNKPVAATTTEALEPASPKPEPLAREPSAYPFTQIVVPVFNAIEDVRELLESICRNTRTPFEVILADDGSSAASKKLLKKLVEMDPRIRLIEHAENIGYTRNINFGLQATTSDFVLLLNSDTIVPPRLLDRLIDVLNSADDVAAVGPLSNAASWQSIPFTKTREGTWAVNELPAGWSVDGFDALIESRSDRAFPEFPLLNGFCTLFRRAALEDAGYFDDQSFPRGYGEENDLCIRLRQKGWRLRVADHCYVYHKKSRSFGAAQRKDIAKKTNAVLRRKHFQIDFTALEEQMKLSPPVNALRQRVLEDTQVELRPTRDGRPIAATPPSAPVPSAPVPGNPRDRKHQAPAPGTANSLVVDFT